MQVFTADRATLHNAIAQTILDDADALPDGSVDLILTDPPYIISKDSGFSRGGDSKFSSYQTDFGGWDRDEFTMDDLERVVTSFQRVLRPGGVAVVFIDLWKVSDLATMMVDAGFLDVVMIEWLKANAVPVNSRKNYLSNAREVAVVGRKPGAPATFKSDGHCGTFKYTIFHSKDRFHPTQKSLLLFEELIEMHTGEGDMVLDCFSGSATTGVAALNTGRCYVGCEPDAEFFRRSSERLAAC